jgi:hypothetical protein
MADLGKSKLLRSIYDRFPRLQPVLREINALISGHQPPTFFGWLMTTWHQVPWIEGAETFLEAADELNSFEMEAPFSASRRELDSLMWRHWNVAYSVKHSIAKMGQPHFTGVECGVGEGMSAHIAASQIGSEQLESASLHLYDAWSTMHTEQLLESETSQTGSYGQLSMQRTRKNLSKHSDIVFLHPGYIPESFDAKAPEAINWLHIDLNSAVATEEALSFFWPRLLENGVIVLDDYGWTYFEETRKIAAEFFDDKPGTLMPLPTGQAFYFR